jgi:hypothetical protein
LFGDPFSRTELFFGLSRSNGPEITDARFDNFVDGVITERFPDGLTVLDGSGQFRNASGVTIEEPSRLVILLYPPGDPTSSDRIERSGVRTRSGSTRNRCSGSTSRHASRSDLSPSPNP